MNCDQAREQLTDYLTREMPVPERADLESHLAGCAACRRELGSLETAWSNLGALPAEVPGPETHTRFQAMLEAYRQGLQLAERNRPVRQSPAQWLARLWPRQPALQFALVAAVFAAGLLLGPALPRTGGRPHSADDRALAQLRAEVAGMKQMMAVALLQQQSVSERLRGVEWSCRLARPDAQVLSALLRALDTDPNVNVRLAAVDALHQFAGDDTVRQGLLRALGQQKSPLVQVELINLMVDLNEKQSVPVLRDLSRQPELNPAVRERADWGLQKLG